MWDRASPEHSPGYSTRKLAAHRQIARLTLAALVLGASVYILGRGLTANNVTALAGCLIALIAVDRTINILDTLRNAERRANRGAEAEEKVGALLNRLPEGFLVLHDICARYGNIDHLVFRPDGVVFLIETKAHRGTVTERAGELLRDGRRFEKNILRQTQRNLFWLRDFLRNGFGVEVSPRAAIVFPNANVAVAGQVQGIDVLRLGDLEAWIANARPDPRVARALSGCLEQVRISLLARKDTFMLRRAALPVALMILAAAFIVGAWAVSSILQSRVLVVRPFTTSLPQTQPAPSVPSVPAPRANVPLADLMAAAEAGDALSQDKLGEVYRTSGQSEKAVFWYRKSAPMGVANSQYQLAHILLSYAGSPLTKNETAAMHVDEAIPWLVKAARQGVKPAQLELGQLYQDGKSVTKDTPEAYKWFTLAAEGTVLDMSAGMGKASRDPLILRMSQAEIAEGDRRVAAFKASPGSDRNVPEPAFVEHIILSGISGVPPRALAIINGKTVAAGESATIKVDYRLVTIHCLTIGANSATIAIDGVDGAKELRLR